MNNEEEILRELRELNAKLDKLVELLCYDRVFGGMRFSECMTRTMYGVE